MSASEHELNRTLRALAQATPLCAPPALETRLLEQFRANRRAHMRRRMLRSATAAIAAGVLLFTVLHYPSAPKTSAYDPPDSDYSSFMLLPDADPIDPSESGAVVRVQLNLDPDSIDDASPPETVQADVLLGEDGRAHAVRFLP